MPHYTNDSDGSLVLHFGQGDIAVCTGRATDSRAAHDEDELLFVVGQGKHPIGDPAGLEGRRTDELREAGLQTPVRLVFDNIESLDVVLDKLWRLREGMSGRPARDFPMNWNMLSAAVQEQIENPS